MTTITVPPDSSFTRSRSLSNTTARITNVVMQALCYISAAVAILALFLIFGYVAYRGISAFNLDFFTKLPPLGMRNCIAGSVTLVGMASCIGIPLGMLCGIYLAEYAGTSLFSQGIRLVVDVLAGVPSILVGVLGYELVTRPMGGASAWGGSLALGVMMCPIVARTTEEMLRLVPKALREASTGLGASKFQTLFRVVIPGAASGIITGVMLAVARVAGETAPLLFTAGMTDQPIVAVDGAFPWVHIALNSKFPSITARIYQCYSSPEPLDGQMMWMGLFVLIVIVLALNICVRFASRKKF